MPDRLIELTVAEHRADDVQEIVKRHAVSSCWALPPDDGRCAFRILVVGMSIEPLVDDLEHDFELDQTFRLIVLPVEAVLPKPKKPEPKPKEPDGDNGLFDEQAEEEPVKIGPSRISRIELYDDIATAATPSNAFMLQAILASLVAAIGLSRDLPAVVIAAMVIAPLLGPHMGVALATTLGDKELAWKSMKATVIGGVLTGVVAIAYGVVAPIDPTIPEIAGRTTVTFSDVLLALASGTAGALAFTAGLPSSLVGVMVAVALVPPAVTACMLTVKGNLLEGAGAGLLLMTNLVCVNLSAVATFSLQGVRPRRWYERSRSKKATRWSLIFWTINLLIIIALIVLLDVLRDARVA
ncbi:MAG: TIGR00341 family protein [Planctomycetota bacterium]